MKKTISVFLSLLMGVFVVAQQQNIATRTGKYTGVFSIFSNPASIAASPRKWDVSLFSANIGFANDNVKIGMKSFTDKNDLKNKWLNGDDALSGLINAEITGPSFMFNISPNHAIGISTRGRIMGNISTVNKKMLRGILEADKSSGLPYDLATQDQVLAVNGWTELGGTWAGVVFNKENHLIKAGATVKYLQGVSSSFVDIENLQATINVEKNSNNSIEPYLTNGQGALKMVNAGVDFMKDNIDADDFTESNASGFGIDLGVVYEYRKEEIETDEIEVGNNLDNPYLFKVGISILDLGSLKYTVNDQYALGYTLNIPSGEKLYLSKLNGSFDEVRDYLDKSPYAVRKNIDKSYTTSLPTTLNASIDYNVGSNFYAEFIGQLSLVNNDDKVQNPYYYNSFTFIPRFENRFVGFYLPLNYNTLTEFNMGATLRLGPLMIGSSSILSHLMGEHKQVDMFVGVRFGM